METNSDIKPQSTLTVLERSRELHILLSKVILDDNLLPKVYRWGVGKPVTDHSQAIYESLAVANTLDLYDKELTEERKKYQIEARRELTKLLAALRIMYSISNMDSDKMKVLLDKTIEVERLLKKWMESDRNRIGTALNIVKKDVIDTHVFDKNVTVRDLFEPRSHVDFDSLLKDARVMPPPQSLHHETHKPVFIPPADSLPKPNRPDPVYVVKSEEERVADFKKSRFDLSNIQTDPNISMPMSKDKFDRKVETKPIQAASLGFPSAQPEVIVVRDKPIVVPDNRIAPEPPPEDDTNKPLAPNVEIVHNATPEMVTEDLPKEEEKTEICPTDPNPNPELSQKEATTTSAPSVVTPMDNRALLGNTATYGPSVTVGSLA